MLLFSLVRLCCRLCAAAAAGCVAVQSAGYVCGRGNLLVQYRRQLHDQHELAGIRRRDDDELSDPDGRPHRAEFRVGGGRHRARHRTDPRLRPPFGEHGRQFLGRSDAVHPVRAVAAVDHRRAGAGGAGDAAEPRQPMSTQRPWKAPSKQSRRDRSPRRSQSNSSARMAAVSSTPIPACRTRTRTRSPT